MITLPWIMLVALFAMGFVAGAMYEERRRIGDAR